VFGALRTGPINLEVDWAWDPPDDVVVPDPVGRDSVAPPVVAS